MTPKEEIRGIIDKHAGWEMRTKDGSRAALLFEGGRYVGACNTRKEAELIISGFFQGRVMREYCRVSAIGKDDVYYTYETSMTHRPVFSTKNLKDLRYFDIGYNYALRCAVDEK